MRVVGIPDDVQDMKKYYGLERNIPCYNYSLLFAIPFYNFPGEHHIYI